jgi:hypothetical protein
VQYLAKHFPNGGCTARAVRNKWISRFIKNRRLRWGGNLIERKEILREAQNYLKNGHPVGVIGDLNTQKGTYTYPFFGKLARFSTAPALLAIKMNVPIFVFTSERKKEGLSLTLSDPILPNKSRPLKEEVKHLMDCVLETYEAQLKENPESFLWEYEQWKLDKVYKWKPVFAKNPLSYKKLYAPKKAFGLTNIACIFPDDNEEKIPIHLDEMRRYFKHCNFYALTSKGCASLPCLTYPFSKTEPLPYLQLILNFQSSFSLPSKQKREVFLPYKNQPLEKKMVHTAFLKMSSVRG